MWWFSGWSVFLVWWSRWWWWKQCQWMEETPLHCRNVERVIPLHCSMVVYCRCSSRVFIIGITLNMKGVKCQAIRFCYRSMITLFVPYTTVFLSHILCVHVNFSYSPLVKCFVFLWAKSSFAFFFYIFIVVWVILKIFTFFFERVGYEISYYFHF